MGHFNELYSSFGFFNAFYADVYTAAAEGLTIDLLNANAVTFAIAINSFASAGDNGTNAFCFLLQHGLASADGVSAWSNVPLSQIIHSVEGGYDSTASDGRFYVMGSKTDLGGTTGASGNGIIFAGYKKDVLHRYVRVYLSISGNASAAWMAGVAFTGNVSDWPVNTPV